MALTLPQQGIQLVHPHAGGENGFLSIVKDKPTGSPPRGWGKRRHGARSHHRERFTPTRVGKTIFAFIFAYLPRFTPTRVGKTGSEVGDLCRILGSPPRGWGKPSPISLSAIPYPVHPHAGGENCPGHSILNRRTRFTPTRVGKTCLHGLRVGAGRGSPPRGWGKP